MEDDVGDTTIEDCLPHNEFTSAHLSRNGFTLSSAKYPALSIMYVKTIHSMTDVQRLNQEFAVLKARYADLGGGVFIGTFVKTGQEVGQQLDFDSPGTFHSMVSDNGDVEADGKCMVCIDFPVPPEHLGIPYLRNYCSLECCRFFDEAFMTYQRWDDSFRCVYNRLKDLGVEVTCPDCETAKPQEAQALYLGDSV